MWFLNNLSDALPKVFSSPKRPTTTMTGTSRREQPVSNAPDKHRRSCSEVAYRNDAGNEESFRHPTVTAHSAHGTRGMTDRARDATKAMEENNHLLEHYNALKRTNNELMRQVDQLSKTTHEFDIVLDNAKNERRLLEHSLKKTEQSLAVYIRLFSHVCQEIIEPYHAQEELNCNLTQEDLVYQALEPVRAAALKATPLESEVHLLHSQVSSLQKQLLGGVEKVQSMPDEEFLKAFRQLASSIKTFSRTIKVSSDFDIKGIDCPQEFFFLVQDVPKQYWSTGAYRKAMIEACIWSALIKTVFQTPFSMFGPNVISLGDNFTGLFGREHFSFWPKPTELSEQWKRSTVEQIVNIMGKDEIVNGPTNLDPDSKSPHGSLYFMRCQFQSAVEGSFRPLSPGTDFTMLKDIFDKAIAMALQMFLQRSRLQIVWPEIGELFVAGETSHLAAVLDSEEVEQGNVVFVVNPGLAKWGDAHGKNLETRFDIMPAQVFIEPITESLEEKKSIDGSVTVAKGGVELTEEDTTLEETTPGPSRKTSVRVAVPHPSDLERRIRERHKADEAAAATVQSLANWEKATDQEGGRSFM